LKQQMKSAAAIANTTPIVDDPPSEDPLVPQNIAEAVAIEETSIDATATAAPAPEITDGTGDEGQANPEE
jgi:hypothetical protein